MLILRSAYGSYVTCFHDTCTSNHDPPTCSWVMYFGIPLMTNRREKFVDAVTSWQASQNTLSTTSCPWVSFSTKYRRICETVTAFWNQKKSSLFPGLGHEPNTFTETESSSLKLSKNTWIISISEGTRSLTRRMNFNVGTSRTARAGMRLWCGFFGFPFRL